MEKSVYISINKTSSFDDFKNCQACCHVLIIRAKHQKQTIILFGGPGTHCLPRKTSRDDKKAISISEEISPPITIKHKWTWAKKGKNHSIYGIIVSTPHIGWYS